MSSRWPGCAQRDPQLPEASLPNLRDLRRPKDAIMLKRLRWSILVLAALLASCGGGGGSAPAVPGSPAPASFGPRIDDLANRQIAAGLVPSLVIAVERGGTIVFAHAYGSRSLAPSAPADPATAYQLGSLTKAFTAAAVLLLAHDGALSLDDPLAKYVPEYPPGATITLRQMLNMVSGIPADVNAGFTTLYGPIDHAGVVRRLASVPLDFTPGTAYEYSNDNYYLLGIVIERVSGRSWDAFVGARILAPLGLGRIGYLATWNDPDTSAGYWHRGAPANAFEARPSWSADYLYAFGGLVGDATALLRWDETLRAPGFLDAQSLATMFAVPAAPRSPYAMGWFVDPDGTRWHDGETSGFNTANALYRDGYDVVVLGNTWDQYSGAFDPVGLLQAVHAQLPP